MSALLKILKKVEAAANKGRWDMVQYYLSQATDLAKLNEDTEYLPSGRGEGCVMDDHQKRITILKAHLKNINESIYPDGYEECVLVMTIALQDRIKMLEELCSANYLPSSQVV